MLLRATSIMFTGELAAALFLFLRNIVIARLISVEDFGIAATLSVLFAVIETIANLSVNKLLVQDEAGDDPRFLATIHSVQVLRGLVSAALMLALAWPYAAFVRTPDIVWAYQVMAVVPLVRGFLHLDMYRVQRDHRFAPFALNIGITTGIGLVSAALFFLIWQDWRVMLGSIIAQQVSAVLLSHLQAEERFALAWDGAFVRRTMRFGLPLLGSGLLFMAIATGERMIVANRIDLVTLGWFTAAFLLATAPTRILSATSNAMFLPRLSRAWAGEKRKFRQLSTVAFEANLLLAIWMAVGVSVFGPLLLIGLFDEAYAPGLSILILLGVSQAFRVARTAPNTIAMAAGRTNLLLHMGIIRASGLPVAFAFLAAGYGLVSLAIVAIVYEALAFAYGTLRLSRRFRISLRRFGLALGVTLTLLALVIGDLALSPPSIGIAANFHFTQILLIAGALGAVIAMPDTMRFLRQSVLARRGEG